MSSQDNIVPVSVLPAGQSLAPAPTLIRLDAHEILQAIEDLARAKAALGGNALVQWDHEAWAAIAELFRAGCEFTLLARFRRRP